MPISPINFFISAGQVTDADALSTLTSSSLLSALTGTTRAELNDFAATLGQILSRAGTLALGPSLFGETDRSNSLSGTNGLFDSTLLGALGVSSNDSLSFLLDTSNVTVTDPQPLPPDTTNLGGIFFHRGADGTLFIQVRLNDLAFDVNLEPLVFSSSVLAQRFQVGNGTGTPA